MGAVGRRPFHGGKSGPSLYKSLHIKNDVALVILNPEDGTWRG